MKKTKRVKVLGILSSAMILFLLWYAVTPTHANGEIPRGEYVFVMVEKGNIVSLMEDGYLNVGDVEEGLIPLGYTNKDPGNPYIAIQKGMSRVGSVVTCFHEIMHKELPLNNTVEQDHDAIKKMFPDLLRQECLVFWL